MSNAVLYDATKRSIHSVSVFQANRAEVNRRISVKLREGQNAVEITNLPNCLDQSSIRVDGIGQAVIFDVVYSPPPPLDTENHAGALSGLNNRRSALEAEWKILRHQAKALVNYSKSLKSSDTSADQLIAFLNVYEEKQRRLDEGFAVLKEKIRQVDDEIRDAQITLNADEQSLQRAVKISVIVLADEDGPAELSLTYVVSNAWWTPLYNLRAAIAHDAKSTSTVLLHYRASISQSTGEDWLGVALTLSTASPLQGTAIPTLQPEWITGKYKPPAAAAERGRNRPAGPIIIPARSRSRSYSPPRPIFVPCSRSRSPEYSLPTPPPAILMASTPINPYPVPPPGTFPPDSAAGESAVSATFTIAGLSSIPSNATKSSQTHKVSIAEIKLSAVELEWVTIPREIPSVFLQCKVQNTSEYVLLPGQTSIFMDNNFVSKSTISHVSPKESFTCSLGVDPAVRVTYHPQSKKSKSTGSIMLASKTTGTTFRQRTTIKNTRPTALHRLILTDQVPVSDDARIKVNVLEPKDLQIGNKGTKETVVKAGVKARWAQKNVSARTMEEGGGETGLGFVEWICEIGAGASIDVDLAWDVVAPAGVEWVKR